MEKEEDVMTVSDPPGQMGEFLSN